MSKSKKRGKKKKEEPLEELDVLAVAPSDPEDLDMEERAMLTASETGRERLNEALRQHTSAGPELAGGDLDANWEAAEAFGDEAPGGHMPTPDQDVVDEIGEAVGLEMPQAAELQASGEVLTRRDRRRWELDPVPGEDLARGSRRHRRIEDIPVVLPLDELVEAEELEPEETETDETED